MLTDVSNVPSKRAAKGKKEKAPTKTVTPKNLPNFDSFDEYSLNVQPITPMKTHVSQSTNSRSYNWDKYTTSSDLGSRLNAELLDSPVASSPRVYISRADVNYHLSRNPPSHQLSDASSSSSRIVTRSMSDKLCHISPAFLRSKRQRRLQRALNDSYGIDTSTPDRVLQKKTRLGDLEASPVRPVEEDLILSMEHMSLHESVHRSLTHTPDRCSQSQPTSYYSCEKLDYVSVGSSQSAGQRSSVSRSLAHSESLFSTDDNVTSDTTGSACPGGVSNLEDLLEEEETDVSNISTENDAENGSLVLSECGLIVEDTPVRPSVQPMAPLVQ